MKECVPYMQDYALEYLSVVDCSTVDVCAMISCYVYEIFIGTSSLRTVVEGVQGLCLISVKQNVSCFF